MNIRDALVVLYEAGYKNGYHHGGEEHDVDHVRDAERLIVSLVAEWLKNHEDNGTLWDIGGVGGSVADEWRRVMGG